MATTLCHVVMLALSLNLLQLLIPGVRYQVGHRLSHLGLRKLRCRRVWVFLREGARCVAAWVRRGGHMGSVRHFPDNNTRALAQV